MCGEIWFLEGHNREFYERPKQVVDHEVSPKKPKKNQTSLKLGGDLPKNGDNFSDCRQAARCAPCLRLILHLMHFRAAHLLRSTWSEGQVPKSGPEIKVPIIPQIVKQK